MNKTLSRNIIAERLNRVVERSLEQVRLSHTMRQIKNDRAAVVRGWQAAQEEYGQACDRRWDARINRPHDQRALAWLDLEVDHKERAVRAYDKTLVHLDEGYARAARNHAQAERSRAMARVRTSVKRTIAVRVNVHRNTRARRSIRIATTAKPSSTADPDGEPDSRRASRSSAGGVA